MSNRAPHQIGSSPNPSDAELTDAPIVANRIAWETTQGHEKEIIRMYSTKLTSSRSTFALLLGLILIINCLVMPAGSTARTNRKPSPPTAEATRDNSADDDLSRAAQPGPNPKATRLAFAGSSSRRYSKSLARATDDRPRTGARPDDSSGFKVMGKISYADGTGIPGVTLTVSGPHTLSAQTDVNGNYEISNVTPDPFGYNLSAVKSSYKFSVRDPIHVDPNSNQSVNLIGVSQTPLWEPASISFSDSWIRTLNENGRVQAQVILAFPSSDFRVSSWGQISTSGNSYIVSPTVEHWTGNTSAIATSASQFFDLGPIAPGTYTLGLKVSGVNVKSLQFPVSAAEPTNPIDVTGAYVAQNYADFLGRPPDTAGLQFWTANIDSCGANQQCRDGKRIDTSAAFFLSIEFQQTGYLVDRFYLAAYGRRPSFSEFMADAQIIGKGIVVGQNGWEQALESNKQAFARDFISRPEFVGKYEDFLAFDDFSGYVSALIKGTGVTFTQAERDPLVNGLLSGSETFATVLRKVAENQTFFKAEFNPAFVLMEYFGYLRRDPDDAGFKFWLNKLNSFGGSYVSAEMVKSFIVSSEYRSRFDRRQLILSKTAAIPGETLQLQSADFTPGAITTVKFSDQNGYTVPAPATAVTNTTVSVQVPIYFDKVNARIGPGSVTVNVTQTFAGEVRQIGAGVPFQIGDLPQVTSTPGKVTAFVLTQMANQLATDQTLYQLIQKRSGNKVNVQSLTGHLAKLQSDVNAENNTLLAIANGTRTSVKIGSVSGHDIALDKSSLALMDRIFVACLSSSRGLTQPTAPESTTTRDGNQTVAPEDDIDPNLATDLLNGISSYSLRVGEKLRGNFSNLFLVAGIGAALLGVELAPAIVVVGAAMWAATTLVPLAISVVTKAFAADLSGFSMTPHDFEAQAKFIANAGIDAAGMYDAMNLAQPTADQLVVADVEGTAAKTAADWDLDQPTSLGVQIDQNLPAVVNSTDCTGTDGDEPDGDDDDPDYCLLATGGSTAPINFQP